MYFTRKLKPAQLGSEFLIPLLALPVLLIIYFYWGQRALWGAIAIIYSAVVVMHLNMFFQTKNKSFLWLAAAFGIIVIFAAFIAIYGLKKNDPVRIPFTVAAATAIVCIGYILFTKRVKWRTREILELAAMPVEEIKNGYTERPLSLGKIDATEYEIDSFSRFISKNLIAMPYRKNGNTFYSLSNSYLKQYGFKKGYEDESWVSFSKDGSVNAFISKNDYLLYRDAFSFDQLCANLGQLFIDYFEIFRKGEGIRIIDKLNAMGLNPITE